MPDELTPPTESASSLLGTWRLLEPAANPAAAPGYYMDLVFRDEGGRVQGALRSRTNGVEVPLERIEFDGTMLAFQSAAAPGRQQADMPKMVMVAVGGVFEGQWTRGGRPFGAVHRLERQV